MPSIPSGWRDFDYRGRPFVIGEVTKGQNEGKKFKVARILGERYAVTDFFASGGCGLLLRGVDTHTDSGVLIKTILNYDLLHDSSGRDVDGMMRRIREARKQLQTERRIMVQLKNRGCNAIPNPNDYIFDWNPLLVGPYKAADGSEWSFDDDATINTEPYLVMEEINGKPLDDIIGNGLPESRALTIMHAVCGVLSIAHKPMVVGGRTWQLVYQDLKPANILVGEHDYVSLLDWGGCRLTFLPTMDIGMKGATTPGYCAPESEFGLQLSPAFDCYTVGSTLFHMLTGVVPTSLMLSTSLISIRKSLRSDEWKFEVLEKRALPKTCEFIRKCLSEQPADRPKDGMELTKQLAALVKAS